MDSDIDDDILNEILNDDNTKDKKKQTKSPLNTNNDDTNKSVNSVEEKKNQNVPKKRLMQELFLDDTKEKSVNNSRIISKQPEPATITPTKQGKR